MYVCSNVQLEMFEPFHLVLSFPDIKGSLNQILECYQSVELLIGHSMDAANDADSLVPIGQSMDCNDNVDVLQ